MFHTDRLETRGRPRTVMKQAFAGLTIGGIVAYTGDGTVSAIRHWLKIN
jgi:hypothetical protein